MQVSCGNSITATASLRDVDLDLDVPGEGMVGSVHIPEGNSITLSGDTRQVTADPLNPESLTVVDTTGAPLVLAPGDTVTITGPAIPAVSTWGLLVLGLAVVSLGSVIAIQRARLRT